MQNNVNLTSEILECCRKREEVLKKGQSVRKYNKHFTKMSKLARVLISEGRQEELISYLSDESVSVRRDISGLLYNSYPELCKNVLREISEMTVATGLPECFVNVAASASFALEHRLPQDFP